MKKLFVLLFLFALLLGLIFYYSSARQNKPRMTGGAFTAYPSTQKPAPAPEKAVAPNPPVKKK